MKKNLNTTEPGIVGSKRLAVCKKCVASPGRDLASNPDDFTTEAYGAPSIEGQSVYPSN